MLGAALLLSACTGLFDGIYDEPPQQHDTIHIDSTSIAGQLYIDASDWAQWHYVDLDSALHSARRGDNTARPIVLTYAIPTEMTQDADTTADGKAGIYTYWYDVWEKGISVNEFRSFMPTSRQPEPPRWTFAVHRNNVRTNGGAVCETQLTDIAQAGTLSPADLQAMTYTADSWSENGVWVVQAQMLNCLIGSQGIAVNTVLSSWLRVSIPPMPPAFTLNSHVFILRLTDGTFAALQLVGYIGSTGTKCCLTINYRYPI